jgi:hypothetical protein
MLTSTLDQAATGLVVRAGEQIVHIGQDCAGMKEGRFALAFVHALHGINNSLVNGLIKHNYLLNIPFF